MNPHPHRKQMLPFRGKHLKTTFFSLLEHFILWCPALYSRLAEFRQSSLNGRCYPCCPSLLHICMSGDKSQAAVIWQIHIRYRPLIWLLIVPLIKTSSQIRLIYAMFLSRDLTCYDATSRTEKEKQIKKKLKWSDQISNFFRGTEYHFATLDMKRKRINKV